MHTAHTMLKRRNQMFAAARIKYSPTIVAPTSAASGGAEPFPVAVCSEQFDATKHALGGSQRTCDEWPRHRRLSSQNKTKQEGSFQRVGGEHGARTARPSAPRERRKFPIQRTQSTG